MAEISQAKKLLFSRKYREAAKLLDEMLVADKDNDEVLFLRAVVSLKLQNHDNAISYLTRALIVKKKGEYYRTLGMAHLEIFELEKAAENFWMALQEDENDIDANFFLAICYMLMDNHKSEEFLKRAYQLDKKRTKILLRNFYTLFLRDDPKISDLQKRNIEEQIKKLN